jgi:hypothetical protein
MEIQNKYCQRLAKIPSNFSYMSREDRPFDRQVRDKPGSTRFVDAEQGFVRLLREAHLSLMAACRPARRIEAGRAGKGSPIFHVQGSILLQ